MSFGDAELEKSFCNLMRFDDVNIKRENTSQTATQSDLCPDVCCDLCFRQLNVGRFGWLVDSLAGLSEFECECHCFSFSFSVGLLKKEKKMQPNPNAEQKKEKQ